MSRRRNTHYSHKHENRPTKAEREAQKQTARFDEDDDTFVELAEVQQSATDFLEKYQKHIVGVASVIILLVGAYLAYKHLVVAPKEKAAVEAIYKAQAQFEQDSFALALENPGGGFDGFITIIDKYSGTKSSNIAKYYAGISYLNLGRFDDAIKYLKDFDPDDVALPIMKNGALGDAYAELGDKDNALSYYNKAANGEQNDLLTPYYLNKVGLLAFSMGKNDEALKAFKKIQSDFPKSNEFRDADKMVTRLQ